MPTRRSARPVRCSASRMSGASAVVSGMGPSIFKKLATPFPYVGDDTDGLIDALDGIVLPFLESLYARFGYIGVVIAMSIESAAIPIPSELILPFAGWSVARGVPEPLTGAPWSYWGAVLAGVIGNTLGSLVSYAVGAFGGRPILERYGRYVLISRNDLDVADQWFVKYGDWTVFFS